MDDDIHRIMRDHHRVMFYGRIATALLAVAFVLATTHGVYSGWWVAARYVAGFTFGAAIGSALRHRKAWKQYERLINGT